MLQDTVSGRDPVTLQLCYKSLRVDSHAVHNNCVTRHCEWIDMGYVYITMIKTL